MRTGLHQPFAEPYVPSGAAGEGDIVLHAHAPSVFIAECKRLKTDLTFVGYVVQNDEQICALNSI